MSDDLSDSLTKLALNVIETAYGIRSGNEIAPEREVLDRWKVSGFRYSDKGVSYDQARGERIVRLTWDKAASRIEELVKKSPQYDLALQQLVNTFGKPKESQQALDRFVQRLVVEYLHRHESAGIDQDKIVEGFLKDIRGEPVRCGAAVELDGVVLRPDRVEISQGIVLRKTAIEDLEKPFLMFMSLRGPFLRTPSAILDMELFGRPGIEVQKRVHLAIVILRLFRVGSVGYQQYCMYTDSIIEMLGRGTLVFSGEIRATNDTYLITEQDVPILVRFWQATYCVIPPSLIGLSPEPTARDDHLAIAYNRYSDASLHDGIPERRIMNGVMGLEALFLKSGEKDELAYRLGLRVSKLLGLLGYGSNVVRHVISDSYKVRNSFVHGGYPSEKDMKRLRTKYQDIKNLLQLLLDYLRASMVVMILSNRKKKELVNLLDASLVDGEKEKLLKNAVSSAGEVLVVDERSRLLEREVKTHQEYAGNHDRSEDKEHT
jgi:hypothetical protein